MEMSNNPPKNRATERPVSKKCTWCGRPRVSVCKVCDFCALCGDSIAHMKTRHQIPVRPAENDGYKWRGICTACGEKEKVT